MIKKLVSHLGEYKRAAVLTPLFAALEAVMDVLLPTIMAFIIDLGIEKGDMHAIVKYGLLTFLVAAIALLLGVLAGKYAAEASTGFAGNLRDAMYENIQHYSFSNIDKFSTAGLVTRMTTDVTNVQNAFQMIERMCVRAPVHLVFALFMAVVIGGPLSLVFVVAVVFLVAVLASIMIPTFHIFDRVFKNYDNLNASVQENVSAIRVVKSFVREGFENEKYTKACESLYNQFVKAESRLSFNNPAMLTAVYGCNIALSWLGAKYVLHGAITTGQLNALFGYIMNILMALMMLSMVFVMIAMSAASAKRIVEVLDETTDLPPAKQPVQQVKDGSIEFDHVSFQYKHGSGRPVLNGYHLFHQARRDAGHHRRHRQCKVQPGAADPPPVRCRKRYRAGRRRGCAGLQPGRPAPRSVHGAAEERAVQRHHPRQPALGRRERQRGRVHPGGQAGLCG